MLYAFGGNTNETPETIKQKREIARALLAARAPQTVGDGLNSIGDGIVAAVMNSRANDAEKAGQESASLDFAPFFSPSNFPSAPSAAHGDTSSGGVTKTDLPRIGSMEAGRAQDRASDNGYTALSQGGNDVAGYIRQAALSRGIDPNIALKVAGHEGLNGFDPTKPDAGGDGGSSFGPMQLHYGGINPDMPHPGLGDEFTKATGLDAKNPATWKDQVDFAMNYAAKNGWSPWMGAKAEGITGKMGIGTPATQMAYAPQAQPNGEASAIDAQMAPTPPADIPWLQYDNKNAVRNLPLSDKLQSSLGSFLPEMGITAKVFSGGQPEKGSGLARVGSVRHDHGDAADVLFYKDGRQLDWNNPKDLPVFQEIVRRGKDAGLTGFGAGPGYMQPGSMHVGFGTPGVWGAGGASRNAPKWLVDAFGGNEKAANVAQALAKPMPTYDQAMTAFQPQSGNAPAVDAINSIAPQSGVSPVALALAQPQNVAPASVQPSGGVQVAQNTVGAPVASDASRSAVVKALAGQSSNVQPGYFPAAPNQPGQAGLSRAQIIRALTNPFATDEQKMIAKDAYERMQKANDPATQLDLEYKRSLIDAQKGKKAKNWQKLDDTTLYDPESGETKKVGGPAAGAFRFSGTSVEAQGLNGLLDAGKLTPEQAQQIAAGKTITGPNGEVIFMTPQGIFSQQPGQAPEPMQQNKGIDIFAGSQPSAPAPAQNTSSVPGGIELTGPKKPTVDEKNAMTYADRMTQSNALVEKFGNAGLSKTQQMLHDHLPFGLGDYATSEEYRKLDQAKRDFINAQLRRESGAVISPQEFDNAEKQYFPQPNDPPELLKQKAENRRLAVEGMIRDAGPTYKRIKPKTDFSDGPPIPQTKEEFDALPSGTVYIDPDDNKQYRKP